MHPDVQSLLAVQKDDLEIYALEAKLASLQPRLAALEKERAGVASALARVQRAVEAEESRQREARGRIDTNRQLVERSQRQYESVTTPREAAAALTQLEQTKRMVEDSELEAGQVQGRIEELRHQVAALEQELAAVETKQAEARGAIAEESAAIEQELSAARDKRTSLAGAVPNGMLRQYDRVRLRRRNETVFPLRGASCSACDTAIPTQRRAAMATSGAIEMCEGCGVLLYAGE